MRLSRNARWAVPAAAVVVVGGVIAGSAIGVAQASPDLPAKTPAQLLADVAGTQKVPALTGTVVESTSLGLPSLPQTGNPTSLASLLTGNHTVKVYYQDAKHFRLAVPQSMTETDIIRNGSTVWLWESQHNSVTKFTLPADSGPGKQAVKKAAAQLPPLTPQQAANQVLQAVGKTTVVSVDSTVSVAGQAAYQLDLAPKDARSTIASVRIAIDGKTSVPLRVQVFAKGSSTPAFQVAYTDISYVTPSSANFAFSAPPGATVTNEGTGSAKSATGQSPADTGFGAHGSGWLTVAEVPQSLLSQLQPSGPSSSASATPPSGGGVFGGDTQLAINAFLHAARPVSGAWGSGQLLHTSLVNVLFVGNEIYLGAVDPSVLYAAVGHATPASANGS